LLSASPAGAQIPFFTDDADTTEQGKFHLEFLNEHDWLQTSSLPGKRQNTTTLTLNYGLTRRIELGVSVPFIKNFNDRSSIVGDPAGVGDAQFGVKARIRDERDGSLLPAVSVAFYVEAPTGSIRRQIGSGLTDYGVYGVLQKSITKRTMGRLNGGLLLAGTRSIAPLGIRAGRGEVFTANGSIVREFTSRLKLGGELFGRVSNNVNLNLGQLQGQVGGSYLLSERLEFTFGVLGGRFPASPRIGMALGLAYDFN
jgi:hypothetical protein